jgi:hypothetical protein
MKLAAGDYWHGASLFAAYFVIASLITISETDETTAEDY